MTTLVLDAGDLLGGRTRKDMLQTEFLVEQTDGFGYDAIGLGERDLNYGWDFLAEAIEKNHLPFTSANVRDAATGELLLPEYLVVEKSGIRFGICSVLDPALKIVSMAAKDREYEVADPSTTLRELIPRMREHCDTVVLLSHLGDKITETLVKAVPGVDVAVIGHMVRPLQRERIVADTVLLAAVFEGRVIGRADVHVDSESGEVMSVQVEITSLDDKVQDDPVMLQAMEDFKQEAEERRLAQRAAYPRNLGAETEQFLGNGNCKACHTQIYQDWRHTGHANAYTVLRAKNMQFEPECLACHTTGYRYYNGFDEQDRTSLSHVQCEACHGYGTQHVRDGEMNAQARESCTLCHDEEQRPCYDERKDGKFEYATFWEKIAH